MLGAAVADDVMGLVVLTVVVRLVTRGVGLGPVGASGSSSSRSPSSSSAALVGLRVAPPLFDVVDRFSRSTGTLVALALAFTLALRRARRRSPSSPRSSARSSPASRCRRPASATASAASWPRSGTCSSRSSSSRSASTPTSSASSKRRVLRDAAILLVVAVVGKLVVAGRRASARRATSWLDRPRDAAARRGRADLRHHRARRTACSATTCTPRCCWSCWSPRSSTPAAAEAPLRPASGRGAAALVGGLPVDVRATAGGWLRVVDGQVRLAATPPHDRALTVALDAAVEMADARPSPELLDYLGGRAEYAVRGTTGPAPRCAGSSSAATLGRGASSRPSACSTRALPEVAETLRARYADPFMLDADAHAPLGHARTAPVARPERSASAASTNVSHTRSGCSSRRCWSTASREPSTRRGRGQHRPARRLRRRSPRAEIVGAGRATTACCGPRRARRGFDEEEVLQLASHLDTPERARAAYVLAVRREDDLEVWERERLGVAPRARCSARSPTRTSPASRPATWSSGTAPRRCSWPRTGPTSWSGSAHAPRAYVARQLPPAIVRHATLTRAGAGDDDSCKVRGDRASTRRSGGSTWRRRDRPGLMARSRGAGRRRARCRPRGGRDLGRRRGDRVVPGPRRRRAEGRGARRRRSIDALGATARGRSGARRRASSSTTSSSPWHTVCEIDAPDTPGLLPRSPRCSRRPASRSRPRAWVDPTVVRWTASSSPEATDRVSCRTRETGSSSTSAGGVEREAASLAARLRRLERRVGPERLSVTRRSTCPGAGRRDRAR